VKIKGKIEGWIQDQFFSFQIKKKENKQNKKKSKNPVDVFQKTQIQITT